MQDEVSKAKTTVEGIREEKRKSVSLTEASAFQQRHDFEEHKRTTESTIQDLKKAIKEMTDSLDSKLHRLTQAQVHAEQEDAHLRGEIDNMGAKLKEALLRLERISMESSQRAQEKETAEEQSGIAEKVRKVERASEDLVHSVEKMQEKTGELEKSDAMWLQKYDAAARILQEIEKRLSGLENASLQDDDPANQPLHNVDKGYKIAPSEKQRLIRLYRELSGFLQKMKTSKGNTESDKNAEDCFGDKWTRTFNDKLVAFETWVKHVESNSLPKLKVLETKTEELSVGMQTALEGSFLAESKCSALGAALVKVFRMLASSRKESPTKMLVGDGDEDSEQLHQQHRARCTRSHHHAGAKSKTLSSHAACTYCKRAAMKGSNNLPECAKEHQDGAGHTPSDTIDGSHVEGHKTGYVYYDSSKHDKMSSPCMGKSYREPEAHRKPHLEPQPMSLKLQNQDLSQARAYHPGGEDLSLEKAGKKSHRKGELNMEKLEDYEALEHFLVGNKKNPELKAFEGKLLITQEKLEEKQLDCANKDTTTHTGSGKNCQSTNIRLEAGKIQVNVKYFAF